MYAAFQNKCAIMCNFYGVYEFLKCIINAYNKMEVMYVMLHVNVEVEWGSPFMFMRGLSCIASVLLTHIKFMCVRM